MRNLSVLLTPDRLIGLPESRARNHNRPQQLPALSGVHVQDVAVGAEHTLALSSTGDVYAWGSNSEGQVRPAAAAEAGQLGPGVDAYYGMSSSWVWVTPTTSGSRRW